jgi:hypothetical protein
MGSGVSQHPNTNEELDIGKWIFVFSDMHLEHTPGARSECVGVYRTLMARQTAC